MTFEIHIGRIQDVVTLRRIVADAGLDGTESIPDPDFFELYNLRILSAYNYTIAASTFEERGQDRYYIRNEHNRKSG